MTNTNNPLLELIRKVESDIYDPKIHGEGFIITWHRQKRELVREKSAIKNLFSRKHYEYYFVKSHSKPIVVKKLPFEWQEGTSDISLDFDATFQLKVSSEVEAEQLVRTLSQSGSAEKGLEKLIDKHLHSCMVHAYDKIQRSDQNLLDEFYHGGSQQGESQELNKNVSNLIRQDLAGTDFSIGFILRDAPEKDTYFTYQSNIHETDLTVNSECQLTLCNYQAYRKSGISDVNGVKQYMQSSIDKAIREHILGKTLMELLSNFKSSSDGQQSISERVRTSVHDQAQIIGYELKSLHTLPDIAPLQLLTGLIVEFSENDGAFKAGPFGGTVKLNLRMEVKAIDGKFEKHKHLLSFDDLEQSVKLTQITRQQIVDRIKGPIGEICKDEILQHNHLEAVTEFEQTVRPGLEKALIERLREEHGLEVNIKSLQPRESEEASRLEELRRKKRPFKFTYISNNGDVNAPLATFSGGFEIIGIDFKDKNCWDAFESHDFGYRSDSPKRQIKNPPIADGNDRQWKNIAIGNELQDIEEELIRYLKASPEFIADLNIWINDISMNRQMQEKLLGELATEIRKNRGLIINIERLAISDESLQEARLAQRQQHFKDMAEHKRLESATRIEQFKQQEKDKSELNEALIKKKIELIEDDISDMDELEEQEKNVEKKYTTITEAPLTLDDFLPDQQKNSEKQQALLNDVLKIENKTNEETQEQ